MEDELEFWLSITFRLIRSLVCRRFLSLCLDFDPVEWIDRSELVLLLNIVGKVLGRDERSQCLN
jgi:hypothetical protein